MAGRQPEKLTTIGCSVATAFASALPAENTLLEGVGVSVDVDVEEEENEDEDEEKDEEEEVALEGVSAEDADSVAVEDAADDVVEGIQYVEGVEETNDVQNDVQNTERGEQVEETEGVAILVVVVVEITLRVRLFLLGCLSPFLASPFLLLDSAVSDSRSLAFSLSLSFPFSPFRSLALSSRSGTKMGLCTLSE